MGGATLYAFDAAYPKPASVYRANGGVAANVYVSGLYAQDAAHVAGLRAGGIAPWPNYEVGLWELVSNRAAGQAAARRGIADAKRCGFPANGTIWFPFSVDVNVNPSQYGAVGAAFDGINDVNAGQYLISCYGQGGLIDYLRATGRIRTKGWLSASSSFPGYNPGSPNVCLVQEVGSPVAGTDRNIITDPAALLAWWPNGETPLGGGTPITPEVDLNAEELQLGLRIFHASKEGHDRIVIAVNDALASGPIKAELTAQAALAVRQVLASQEGHDRTVIAVNDSAVTQLLGDPNNGVVVQLAAARKQIADLATTLTALQAVGLTAEQVAAVSQAAREGAASAGVAGHTINLSGSIA